MEENKNHLFNYATYAAFFLGFFWVFKYLLVILGKDLAILGFLNNLLSIGTPLILFYFLVRYNSGFLENKMSFWHGVQFSIVLFFFASILESVVVFIHVKWIDPAFISNLYSSLIEIAQAMELSPALTAQLMEQPLPNSFSYVFSNVILADVFIGLLLSLFIVPLSRHIKTKQEL
ncbi:MAG: DUF4199 domain-containing protein [Fermentimonas sp.]|jgi:hypothetical protein|nr:DUF4199 domain-containing protein [Fermentimonas sp.]MDD4009459.1 DUF4199 domain-containing protein [Fermentimonas sp.]MDD4697853.1 DUF4199 domain-containing protein [Fermentimonas sp.]